MVSHKYVKPERIWMKTHPEFNEKWVQEKIAEDPSMLGLGDLVLKDKERNHNSAGRLDLLFQDADSQRRYEVEIQLGKSDESHIIRTIEYWDIERKRYPQYDHVAVIVAEDITSRFLNVISLFNGFIPIVAIQIQAIKVEDNVSLLFSTVVNESRLGLVDEDEEVAEVTDRNYWEKRGSRKTLELADEVIKLIQNIDSRLSPKYNKFYIGLSKDGQPSNFVILKPKKDWLVFAPRIERNDEIEKKIEDSGIDLMEYDSRDGRYRLRLSKEDLKTNSEIIQTLIKEASK